MRSSTISPWPISNAIEGVLTTPAAAICNSTTPPGPISARRKRLKKARSAVSTSIICRKLHARASTSALEAKPADMIITTHVCRGNFRSTWISSGGYEPVAPRCCSASATTTATSSNTTPTAPAAFEPLRFLPKGNKIVVLGLVTSKSGRLEQRGRPSSAGSTKRTKFVALDQLGLSPQCGFASTEEGNVLAEDEQWAKLRDDCRAGGRGLGEVIDAVVPRQRGPVRRALSMDCAVWVPDLADARPGRRTRSHRGQSMTQRTTPPFRADHVGSLLRTGALKEARERNTLERRDRRDAQLAGGRRPRNREDHQEAGGGRPQARDRRRIPPLVVAFRFLQGSRRRRDVRDRRRAFTSPASTTKAESVRVTGKVGFSSHPHVEHFKFLKAHTKVVPKMTIPAPSHIALPARPAIDQARRPIPTSMPYFDDVAIAYQKAIRAFYDAGCRYLQLDDTAWSMICDPKAAGGFTQARR